MSDYTNYLCATNTTMGVHGVIKVRIQGQRSPLGGQRIKIVLDREGQPAMEITAFGVGRDMPKFEVVETWEEGKDG